MYVQCTYRLTQPDKTLFKWAQTGRKLLGASIKRPKLVKPFLLTVVLVFNISRHCRGRLRQKHCVRAKRAYYVSKHRETVEPPPG